MALKVRRGLRVTQADAEQFYEILTKKVGRRLELHIHRNRSALLRFERSIFKTRLFVHEAFLTASEDVLEHLARYVASSARDLAASRAINGFIETIETVKRTIRLDALGVVYDLDAVASRIHAEYFDSALDVRGITWFSPRRGSGRSVTLGQFDTQLKIVKINRILDRETCPDYFVDFVVFHELLHAKIPPRFDPQRRRRVIHGPDFRAEEKTFKRYRCAKAWEKTHFKNSLSPPFSL
jgi:hypothetical protein